jgi:hypothetical protein
LYALAISGKAKSIGKPTAAKYRSGVSRVPIACTLSASDQVVRADEWLQLKHKAITRELTDDGARWTFAPETVTAAEVADLVAREATCCQFFVFTLEVTAQHLVLTIAAPEDAGELVAALVD